MIKRENKKVLAMQQRAVIVEKERLNFNYPSYHNSGRKILLTETGGLLRNLVVASLIRAADKKHFIKFGTTQVIKVKTFNPITGVIVGDVYNIKHGAKPGGRFIDKLNDTWVGDIRKFDKLKPAVKDQVIKMEKLMNFSLFTTVDNRIQGFKTMGDIGDYFRGGFKEVKKEVNGKMLTIQEPLPSFIGDLELFSRDYVNMFGGKGALNMETLDTVLSRLKDLNLHNVFADLLETKLRIKAGSGPVPTGFKKGTGNDTGWYIPDGGEIKSMKVLKEKFRTRVQSIAELRELVSDGQMTKSDVDDIADHFLLQFEGLPRFERKFADVTRKETGHQAWNLRGTGGAGLSKTAGTSKYSFSTVAGIEKELLDNPTGKAAKKFLNSIKFDGANVRESLKRFWKQTVMPNFHGWFNPFVNSKYDEMLDLEYLFNNGYKSWDDIEGLPIKNLLIDKYGEAAAKKQHGTGLLDVMDPSTQAQFAKENPTKPGWGRGQVDVKDPLTGEMKQMTLSDEFSTYFVNNWVKEGIRMGYKTTYRTWPKLTRLWAGTAFGALWALWAAENPATAFAPIYWLVKWLKDSTERDWLINKMMDGLMRSNQKCVSSVERMWKVTNKDPDWDDADWNNYFSEQITKNADCREAYMKAFTQIQNTFDDETLAVMVVHYSDWAEVMKSEGFNIQKMLRLKQEGKNVHQIKTIFNRQNPKLNK